MAIPITCPGCKAGFEVPENLTGKTIRCTSCKTQLTVPAPVVEAVEAEAVPAAPADGSVEKKPFGWAAPAAKPAVAATPVAARPATPVVAKPAVAVAVPARPAPKAAAVVADEKTKPVKSTRKPARRDDDDDDEDDDDDRPARRRPKKGAAKGGSPALLFALIGVGVLVVGGAIAGLVFALGGKGEKKDDTANANSTNTNTTPARGGELEPNKGGWQQFQGDGFTAEFPGQPEVKDRIPPDFQEFATTGKSHTVETGNEMYVIFMATLKPEKAPGPGRDEERVLGEVISLMEKDEVREGGVSQKTDVNVGGHPGKEFAIKEKGESGLARVVVAGNRVYACGAMNKGSGGETSANAKRFIESVRITYDGNSGSAGPAGPGPGATATNLPPGWQLVEGDGFTVGMPKRPQVMNPPAQPGIPRMTAYLAENGPNSGYFVIFLDLPPELGDLARSNPDALLDMMVEGAKKGGGVGAGNFGGVKISGGNRITHDSYPGRDLTLEGGGTAGTMRVILVSRRVYMLGAVGTDPASVQQFLATFKIAGGTTGGGVAIGPGPGAEGQEPGPGRPVRPNPGGGVPIVPPMPGAEGQEPGMAPGAPGFQPPGSTPGAPGFQPGGFTVPPAVINLEREPFLAIAFDPERKEVFTVGARTGAGGRPVGVLRRYSYPEFQLKGTHYLPHTGTVAAIDLNKGVLYLASSNNGALVQTTGGSVTASSQTVVTERTVAVGDVEVYDLNPLRSGTVGERQEVKPVAVMPVGSTIRGMVLSPSGDALFVVATSPASAKYRSRLIQFDTTTRKESRKMELPADRPAGGLQLAGKGKDFRLLIPELYTTAKNDYEVMVVRPSAWDTLQPGGVRIPGLCNHLAPQGGERKLVGTCYVNGIARLYLLDAEGGGSQEITGTGRAANNGYAAFSADGKKLFVSSSKTYGLDVYEVSDRADVRNGYKKVASLQQAAAGGNQPVAVGGYFYVSPDGEYLVFQTGAVLEVAKITDHVPNIAALPGTGGNPGFGPGGQPGFGPGGEAGAPGAPPVFGPGGPMPGPGPGAPMPGPGPGAPMPGGPGGIVPGRPAGPPIGGPGAIPMPGGPGGIGPGELKPGGPGPGPGTIPGRPAGPPIGGPGGPMPGGPGGIGSGRPSGPPVGNPPPTGLPPGPPIGGPGAAQPPPTGLPPGRDN